jgi:prophage regulatory protein
MSTEPHHSILIDGVAREPEREKITGVPTSTWYELQDAGLAPKPIPLGPKSRGWIRRELFDWVAEQRAKRDQAAS